MKLILAAVLALSTSAFAATGACDSTQTIYCTLYDGD